MLVVVVIIFLLLSAFFSGSEIAFVSSSKLGIEVKKVKDIRKGAIIAKFFEKPKDFLRTMLIGNTIALVVFTYCMARLLSPYIERSVPNDFFGPWVIIIIATVIILLFGEFIPKLFFRLFANETLYFLATPLSFARIILHPLTWITGKISNWILRYILRAPLEKTESELTRLDLEHFVADSIKDGQDHIDHEIFTNVLNLNQLRTRDCMIPRNEIVFVDVGVSNEEILEVFKKSGHSRILVVDGDIENVLGYVHHSQLLNNPKSLRSLILTIPFVPEVMNTRDLMLRFIKQGTNIACVVDEFGGTAGLITLEDILEEIFGEIEDEYDSEEFIDTQVGEREYVFSGRLELSYLNEKYPQLKLPEGDFHTLSGYIVMTSGHIPEEGDTLLLDETRFVLEKVSETKIEVVRLFLPEEIQPET